jgi:multiple sugar transport system ATP-binding protein
MAEVEFDRVSKIYPGKIKAVDCISLNIADQEFVVLVGPSGCGKSTTLRMVAGLEEISGGIIRIGQRVVNDVPPKDRDIAMVFQNYALYPHMTVYKNMAFGLKLRRVPNAQIHERVLQVARMLDIEQLLDRKPKALSGGQRQRVAVGRAIVREPAAFLFDEPLSNLDAKLRVTTRAELKRLHQRLKITTIYVTHDQEEAMTLGDRIVVMKDGRIQQADAPLVVYNKPVNRFVAGFIGMPPMNFFEGRLREYAGRLVFEEFTGAGLPLSGAGRTVPALIKPAGDLTIPSNGFTLIVPARLENGLRRMIGKPVVLGTRPEHLHLWPAESQRAGGESMAVMQHVNVHVNMIEPLGSEMDVYMNTRLHDQIVARVEANNDLQPDSVQSMYIDLRKVHFFEPGDTGMNLSLQSEPSHAIA